ncbi:hypothetical protein ACFLTH_15595 [Bacteroidota bacterium]
MKKSYLTILALVLIVSTMFQGVFLMLKVSELNPESTIGDTIIRIMEITMCFSHGPPENVTLVNCPNRTREGVIHNCLATANSPDGTNVTFQLNEEGTAAEFFQVDSNGSIEIRTYNTGLETPPVYEKYAAYLGNWSLNIGAISHCDEAAFYPAHINIEIYDENDAPYVRVALPDRTISVNTPVRLFDLDDYFLDPENRPLTYSDNNPSDIVVTTLSSTGDVSVFTTTCQDKTIIFTATDHGGLTASDTITITVDCEDEGGEGAGSSSGGGSGGGASSCISDWSCGSWSRCSPNGTTKRTCVDQNVCNLDYYIHIEEYECDYPFIECEEIWECTEWNDCQPSNTQTRNCVEVNGCGTEDYKPVTIQDCTYEASCSDGIQNQGETGVDCGGPCLPCKTLEVPGGIREEKTIVSTLLILGIFAVLSLLIVYKYFHKQINLAVAKVLFLVIKKRQKRILLADKDKEYLLNKILEFEKNVSHTKLLKKTMDLSVICREYFSLIFKVSHTLTKEQLQDYIKQLKIKEPLDLIFLSFYDKIVLVETQKIKMYKTDLLILIEELREVIHQTSRFEEEDIGKEEVKEIEIEEKDSIITKIKKSIFNLYIAMHYDELDITKTKYSELIELYEELPEEKKGDYYYDIERLFNEIKYLLGTNKK